MIPGYYFHQRLPGNNDPGGVTVSKRATLPPDGDFLINEFCWGPVSLWFLADDEFTADERQEAYLAHVMKGAIQDRGVRRRRSRRREP